VTVPGKRRSGRADIRREHGSWRGARYAGFRQAGRSWSWAAEARRCAASAHRRTRAQAGTGSSARKASNASNHVLQNVPSWQFQGYGMDQTTRYWNDASARLYGYTRRKSRSEGSLLDLIIRPKCAAESRQRFGNVGHRANRSRPRSSPSCAGRLPRRGLSSTAVVRHRGASQSCSASMSSSRLKRREAEIPRKQASWPGAPTPFPDLLFEVGLDGRFHSYHSPRSEILYAAPRDFLAGRSRRSFPRCRGSRDVALREATKKASRRARSYACSFPQGKSGFELSVSRKPVGPGQEPRFISCPATSPSASGSRRPCAHKPSPADRQRAAHMVIMDWDIAKDELSWERFARMVRGPLPKGGKYPLYVDQSTPRIRSIFGAFAGRGNRIPSIRRRMNTDQCAPTGRYSGSVATIVLRERPARSRMLIALQDVTERKLAEAEHARSRRSCREARRWKRWACWPAAWRTTSTIVAASWAT